jgi:hypothetical protein
MGLKEVLSRMKIVEMEPSSTFTPPMEPLSGPRDTPRSPGAPRDTPGIVPGAPADIRELLGGMPPPREIDEKELPAGGPDGDIPDFEAVFKAAGINAPAHGYSAYKVLEILSSPEFANLDSKAKAGALAGFLKMNPTGPVPIADVVQDAVRRDQALDKFEDFLRTKLKARTDEIEKQNRDLQAEIDALALRNRERMDSNRKTLAAEEERFVRWQVTKRIEERKLFDAVAPFVETNPISTGSGGDKHTSRPPAPEPPDSTDSPDPDTPA